MAIKLPLELRYPWSVFRACARMFWPVWYLIVIGLLVMIDRVQHQVWRSVIIALVAGVQLYDLGYGSNGILNLKYAEFYNRGQYQTTKLDETDWQRKLTGKRYVVMADPSMYYRPECYPIFRYLAIHGYPVDYFLFSRPCANMVEHHEQLMRDWRQGKIDPQLFYLTLPQ